MLRINKRLFWLVLFGVLAMIITMGFTFQTTSAKTEAVTSVCSSGWDYDREPESVCRKDDYVTKYFRRWITRFWFHGHCVAVPSGWYVYDTEVNEGACKLNPWCVDGANVNVMEKDEPPAGNDVYEGVCKPPTFVVKFFANFGSTQPILFAHAYGEDELYVGMENQHYGQPRTRNGVGTFMIDLLPGEVADQNILNYVPVYFDGSSWKLWPEYYWVGDWSSEFASKTTQCYLVKQGKVYDKCPGADPVTGMYWPALDLKP